MKIDVLLTTRHVNDNVFILHKKEIRGNLHSIEIEKQHRDPILTAQLNSLYSKLKHCRTPDQFHFKRRIQQLNKKPSDKKCNSHEQTQKDIEQKYKSLEANIDKSIRNKQYRIDHLPKLEYPESLPVSARREEILEAIKNHQVVIVCGETGSGKTTQIPKICLEAGCGIDGFIGHTQPRRLAARTVAARIGDELKSDKHVGYKIRFQDRTQPHTYIKLMTDGILLAEIQQDRFLNQYDTLIIDEAHERSLNIDFLMGYLKWLLPRRSDLKVIITSATIDPEKFSKHFSNAPIIEVSGRTYPVEIRYRALVDDEDESRQGDMYDAITEAVDELRRESRDDILIFLSGEREIREATEALKKENYPNTEILPLFSRLSNKDQNLIFKPHSRQHIILATNVAETSLTVPGIKYVIDTGLARISRYSWRARIQRLPIERISQASANQRSGRCGRTSDGIAIRLYSEEDFQGRVEFTEPEILRTNLASVILQMTALHLGAIEAFPFVEPPDRRLIRDGFKLLFELHAVDQSHQLTPIGRQLARIPVDPQLSRMLIEAERMGAVKEILIIVSALSIQDPRERPMDKQQAADEKHSRFKDKESDFLGYIRLWNYFHEKKEALSQNKLRKLCRQEYLAYMRLREWQDVHYQIKQSLPAKVKINTQDASVDSIHQCLLSGLLSHIGIKDEDNYYLGTHNRKFMIFPGSALKKKQPKWVMAAEMVETSRLFARIVGKIQPQWIEHSAKHLLKHHYSEPHWQKRPAQVGASERLTLYGITINPKRNINFGIIDPVVSRQIFIRHALVYGEYDCKAPFFDHNRNLIEDIENLEAKSRRRDILVDEESLYDFYDQLIPENIYSGKAFEKWRQQLERKDAEALYLNKDYLLQRDTDHIASDQYPDQLSIQGTIFPLSYHFEPGRQHDGVSVKIPHVLLNQLNPEPFDYLVNGLLEEKIIAIIKALPKQIRKQFVPAPHYARACLEKMTEIDKAEKPLLEALNYSLLRMTGARIPDDIYATINLPEHLLMRFQIVDEKGKVIKSGRNLDLLKENISHKATQTFEKIPDDTGMEKDNITQWNFPDLPINTVLNANGISIRAYPALIDKKISVAIKLFDTQEKAKQHHIKGVLRLFMLVDSKQFNDQKRQLKNIHTLCLRYHSTGTCAELKSSIVEAAFQHSYLINPDIRTKAEFSKVLTEQKSTVAKKCAELCHLLDPILQQHHEIHKQLKGSIKPNWLGALAEIKEQIEYLIYPGFLSDVSMDELRNIPRYLKGILRRLDKLQASEQRDRSLRVQVQPLWDQYKNELKKNSQARQVLNEYRWQVEEFRVSLFAQDLGTNRPVSAKRLGKLWNELNG